MMRILLIGAGGFPGSISRYLLSGAARRLFVILEGLVTLEEANIRIYRSGKPN